MSSALIFTEFGAPNDVLKLVPQDMPLLGPGDVRIAMELSPINPSDINYIEGKYGIKPPLPAFAGLEGVGRIVEVGSAVTGLTPGQLVRPNRLVGVWRESVINAAADVQPFPPSLTVEQAAVTSVNPPTAWCLLHEFAQLNPGDWVVQNAANSGVGRAVIQIAHALGLRTINLVRRPELIDTLTQSGADIVLTPDENALAHARAQIGHSPVKLALNAVGGESALTIAKLLTSGGKHVTYGAMARQPLKIPNGLLIFQNLSFHGFWITPWLQQAPPQRVHRMWDALTDFWQRGVLTPGIEKTYPLADFRTALVHAQQEGRHGKIAFKMQNP
jgi:trans-2-enoyl-CoA reductase